MNFSGLLSRLQAFLAQPFQPSGDAVNWTLFFILAITVYVAWMHVLRHITANLAEEI